jgi:hypothetical protein
MPADFDWSYRCPLPTLFVHHLVDWLWQYCSEGIWTAPGLLLPGWTLRSSVYGGIALCVVIPVLLNVLYSVVWSTILLPVVLCNLCTLKHSALQQCVRCQSYGCYTVTIHRSNVTYRVKRLCVLLCSLWVLHDTCQFVWGIVVVQLVETLCCKLEGHGFDSQ